jgi:hypothetical protein
MNQMQFSSMIKKGDRNFSGDINGASTSGRIATGRRAGQKAAKAGDEIDVELAAVPGPCYANVSGVNLDAGVWISFSP